MRNLFYLACMMFLLSCNATSDQGVPTVEPSMIFSSFSPQMATMDDLIQMKGKNFSNITEVSFGGTPAKKIELVGDSIIYATVNSGNSGEVIIRNAKGSVKLNGFSFYLPKTYKMVGTATYEYFYSPGFVKPTTATASVTKIDSGTITIMELNPYDLKRNRFDRHGRYVGPTQIGSFYRISNLLLDSTKTSNPDDQGIYFRFGSADIGYQPFQWALTGGTGGNYCYAIKTDSGFVMQALDIGSSSIPYYPGNIIGIGVFKNGKLNLQYESNAHFGITYMSTKKASLVSQ